MRARCAQPKNHNELRAFTQAGTPPAYMVLVGGVDTVRLAFEAAVEGWTS